MFIHLLGLVALNFKNGMKRAQRNIELLVDLEKSIKLIGHGILSDIVG